MYKVYLHSTVKALVHHLPPRRVAENHTKT